MSMRLGIEFEKPPEGVAKKTIHSALKQCVSDFVRENREDIESLNLKLTVKRCIVTRQKSALSIQIAGDVNGQPLKRLTKASREPDRVAAGGGGSIVGHAVSKALATGVNSVAQTTFGNNAAGEPFRQCFEECVADLEMTLNSALGIDESLAADVWKIISTARWILAAAIPLGIAAINPRASFLATAAVAGSCVGIPCFFLVHVVGLLFMPTSFFTDDPRGRKQLARAGVRSVGAARVLCAVLAFIFFMIFAVSTIVMTLHDGK